ncbi:MAG: FAD-binding oxidoreductase [Micrococcales bacterium]|nr:FAD-binding oxidoreductase [Micrococcales bacterium]
MTAQTLADDLPGAILPGDPDWDAARTPWNVAVDQRPAAVTYPRGADDVVAALTAARRHGLRVAVQGTGHSAAGLAAQGGLADTLLLNMSRMRSVTIDPAARTARVEAGVVWAEVTQPAAEHGLAALAGSSPDVGVVGYTLGGGLSWMARAHGLAANQVIAAEVVTADAQQRVVDATHEPELFWALRGGGGNVAVVTALEFGLLDVPDIFAGAMFWPIDRAAEVLSAWRTWVDGVPESVTSVARVLNLPPLPELPEPLRGKSFAVVEAAMLVDDESGADLLAPLRQLGPAIDTFARIPMPALAGLHMDPPGPSPALADGLLLNDLDGTTINDFVRAAENPMLLSGEFRHLGGALRADRAEGGAVAALDGDFLCFAVGMVPVPEAAAGVSAAVGGALATLQAVAAPRSFTNFRESPTDPQRLFGPSLERLRAVRAQHDPDGMLRAHQPLD